MKLILTESQVKKIVSTLIEGRYLDSSIFVDDDNISLEVWDNGNYLELSTIVIPEDMRKKGLGTEIINKLKKYADNVKKDIYLTPDTSFGGTSFQRLVRFYKRMGFKRNKDQSKSHFMVYQHNN